MKESLKKMKARAAKKITSLIKVPKPNQAKGKEMKKVEFQVVKPQRNPTKGKTLKTMKWQLINLLINLLIKFPKTGFHPCQMTLKKVKLAFSVMLFTKTKKLVWDGFIVLAAKVGYTRLVQRLKKKITLFCVNRNVFNR
ncbi:hypothetical protein J6590_103453 [Homalodisca vitripennis]|nr:hypothetical protein J6590_103453 [Homalodisca vitripennis]